MNVAFLLEDTAISARTRLAMAQADALIARGHRARIVTKGTPVTWRRSRAEWIYVDDFREYDAREDTVVDGALPLLIVDDDFYRAATPREHEPLRVLLPGASHQERRAIGDGYGAVAHARWFHQKLELIRVAPWAPSRDEPLESVQEFHVALNTAEMSRLLHACDVLVAPAFTLTAAEAQAAGVPCVLADVPEFRDFAGQKAPFGNAVELGERLIEVLSDAATRERLGEEGRAAAERWRSEAVEFRSAAAQPPL
ncbi:MAG TPA: glycosyltransferase [Thermoanaerobaculia bacterium]|nr:glycosyltransferase [Thermoanaerobaculia bacterium]